MAYPLLSRDAPLARRFLSSLRLTTVVRSNGRYAGRGAQQGIAEGPRTGAARQTESGGPHFADTLQTRPEPLRVLRLQDAHRRRPSIPVFDVRPAKILRPSARYSSGRALKGLPLFISTCPYSEYGGTDPAARNLAQRTTQRKAREPQVEKSNGMEPFSPEKRCISQPAARRADPETPPGRRKRKLWPFACTAESCDQLWQTCGPHQTYSHRPSSWSA